MKKIKYHILFIFLILVTLYSCQKNNLGNDYKNYYTGHEIVYTGAVANAVVQPGNLEIGLKWKASTDPSITKYVIYYNNKADSQIVNISGKADTIKTVIKGLAEYTYSFTIYSYDAKGNKSIPYEVNNAKVYGPIYISTLLNRGYNATNPYAVSKTGYVTLNFIQPDTINIGTIIKYTNRAGQSVQKVLSPDSSSITFPDYKGGTDITYNSSYIPDRNAIDVFYAPKSDVFPKIDGSVPCDKSLFKKVKLPNDMNPYNSGTDIDRLWDGSTSPNGFPNLFHSDGANRLPQTLTFDMGKIYTKLTKVEEIGRNCCHNPDDFEVWGIADITNAATTLAPNDPGWTAEAISKGWKLLKEVKRTDDGQAPFKTDLDNNPPPVRYIRIRVKHNADGEGSYTNITQITMFNNVLN
ncbi:protein of unknown function [Mucilaginibacter lappiensis]|uniref:DUF5000 domain-containing protein n=1 Tax=Mucilaginibacter lappiensis TaxID=354630 RepID=A0ABR6PDS5_9SPHI|nr:DUF4998 domain-containing protein [Mucilaginibacter lappiensis]MBB6107889.1 hypothetical protein [Mucilaginibacter lappiensis]SIP93649.1 protein of unknown function [Mucilaginibacter lappiensis]